MLIRPVVSTGLFLFWSFIVSNSNEEYLNSLLKSVENPSGNEPSEDSDPADLFEYYAKRSPYGEILYPDEPLLDDTANMDQEAVADESVEASGEEVIAEAVEETVEESISDNAEETAEAPIAEGVEEERQLKVLRTTGCDYVQGFLWSHPLPLESVKDLIQ